MVVVEVVMVVEEQVVAALAGLADGLADGFPKFQILGVGNK